MAVRRSSESSPGRRPATTPETREHELINLAEELAARQLREGTASAQVISHYLKLGSSRERLEQTRLENENHLLKVKSEALEAQKGMEGLYEKAIQAMKQYSGQEPIRTGNDYED